MQLHCALGGQPHADRIPCGLNKIIELLEQRVDICCRICFSECVVFVHKSVIFRPKIGEDANQNLLGPYPRGQFSSREHVGVFVQLELDFVP